MSDWLDRTAMVLLADSGNSTPVTGASLYSQSSDWARIGQKVLRDASARYARWKALGIEVESQELKTALELVAK